MKEDASRLGWLALAWFEGFGARTLRRLMSRFNRDGVAAFESSRAPLLAAGVSERLVDRFCEWRSGVDPETFARRLDAENIRFHLLHDVEYPCILAESSDPPAILFVRGAPIQLQRPVAVVGTRSMTPYGSRVVHELIPPLVSAGCEIVSGLALGVDAEAHRAALRANGTTIAVLGSGINDGAIYPRNNAPLARQILENGGTILSEFPPGTESLKHHFPLRNRIIASLSLATIIVEAAEASGSLITASLALDENRDVFSVPGQITSPQSTGTNKLLALGATPCTSADVVLERLGASLPHFDAKLPHRDLSDIDRKILSALEIPQNLDGLVRHLELPTSCISPCVTALEMDGFIRVENTDEITRTPMGNRIASEDIDAPETDRNANDPSPVLSS